MVYHIPSGQIQKTKKHFVIFGKEGKLAVEKIKENERLNSSSFLSKRFHERADEGAGRRKRKFIINLSINLLKPSQNRILLKIKKTEVKRVTFNKDRSLVLVFTLFGDLLCCKCGDRSYHKIFFWKFV